MYFGGDVGSVQVLPVAVVSMEMGSVQLGMGMVGAVGMRDQHRMRTGKLTADDWPRLTHAVQQVQEAQIYIDETPALTSMEVRARARRLARQCGQLGMIIIDYMQLMSGSSSDRKSTRLNSSH